MPIPVVVFNPPPPPPPPEDPFTFGRTAGSWLGGNGDLLALTSCPAGIDWQPGRSGTDMPPFDIGEDSYPAGHGSTPRVPRATSRTVVLPTLVHLPRFDDWRALQQRLLRALNPLAGLGTLTLTQPDGTARQLYSSYMAGAEGVDIADYRGLWYRKWALAFRGFDPFWYAPDDVTQAFGNISPPTLLSTPFLPLKLAESQVLGAASVENVGDVEAYPVWTITGPATSITLTNNTTGETLTSTHPLTDATKQLIIDTRPGNKAVRDQAGVNRWGTLAANPALWALRDGTNSINIIVAGSSSTTRAVLSFRPRFLSA